MLAKLHVIAKQVTDLMIAAPLTRRSMPCVSVPCCPPSRSTKPGAVSLPVASAKVRKPMRRVAVTAVASVAGATAPVAAELDSVTVALTL